MASESGSGDPRVLAVVAFVLLAVGIGLLGSGLWTVTRAFQSRRWPAAPGVVVASEVEAHHGRTDRGDASATTYHPAVRYTYEVAGRRYAGERITFGDYGSTDLDHRREVAEHYPPGAVVSVRYDPDDPDDAVLDPGPVAFNLLQPGLGLVLLAGGALLLVQARRLGAADR